jgi:hypothetical protein
VTEIIPAATQPLPIVQKEIEVQIAEQHSYDRYVKLMQDIDRDIGSNLSLNDIAAKYNLSVSQATLDDSNTEQRKTDNILNNKDFISTVYTTAKDTTSGVTSSIPDTESFVVHVNNIEEAFVMDLQSIRDKVLKIWLKDQQEHLASESIITAREQVAATGKLDEVGYIKSAKINIALLDNKEFTVDQIIEIFAAPLGSVTGVFDLKNGDKAFAKIVSVVSHDPAIVQGFLAENARRFNNLQHVLMNDYFSYLYKTYNVKIYDVSTQ